MSTECKLKPELHESVMQLIAKLSEIHGQGGGSVSLLELVHLVPVPLPPEDEAKIQERGNLTFTKVDEHGGTFSNQGHAVNVDASPLAVVVSSQISGTYLSFPDSCTLTFDGNHTISAKLGFFTVTKLEKVKADQSRVDVDLSGDTFDQCIIHRPPAP